MKIVLFTASELIRQRLVAVLGAAAVIAPDEASVCAELADADALFISAFDYSDAIGRAVAQSPALRWVQILTAGFDRVLKYGVPQGAHVSNAGGAMAPSVATHAVSLLLALQRDLPAIMQAQGRGQWLTGPNPRLVNPAESTCLIIGFGSIGQEIGRLLHAFGARIIGLSRTARPHAFAETATIDRLDHFLPQADTIIIAVPLDATTKGLIGTAQLALCKKTALLVNIARGAIVESEALADALENGVIGGAGLDVTDPEPLPVGHRLWRAPNLIITPHVAAVCGPLLHKRIADNACANAERFLRGEPLQNIVI